MGELKVSRQDRVDGQETERKKDNPKKENSREESVSRTMDRSCQRRAEKHLEVTDDPNGLTSVE